MSEPHFDTVFARSDEDLSAAQALRYDVFVDELGGDGDLVEHDTRLEKDRFDRFARHLLLLDRARGGTVSQQVVGVYRLLDNEGAARAGGFYSEAEFNIDALTVSGLRLLELGRSCLHKDYRGGMAMYHLWSTLAGYVSQEKFDILFGTASFRGTDIECLLKPLMLLQKNHLCPVGIRPIARHPRAVLSENTGDDMDRKTAMTQMPSLIKAYLRLGGGVGDGAHVDHKFNTTDVCLVLDVNKTSDKIRRLYTKEHAL